MIFILNSIPSSSFVQSSQYPPASHFVLHAFKKILFLLLWDVLIPDRHSTGYIAITVFIESHPSTKYTLISHVQPLNITTHVTLNIKVIIKWEHHLKKVHNIFGQSYALPPLLKPVYFGKWMLWRKRICSNWWTPKNAFVPMAS